MKKLFLLLFTSFGLIAVHTQTIQVHVKDSLKQLLQKETRDSSHSLLLAQLAYEYLESKPDTSMILALQALELSRRIGFLKGEAVSLNRVGNNYEQFGNYAKAMEAYLQALKINEEINNIDGVQKNLHGLGLIYTAQGDYRQALDYFFKAKILAEQLNSKRAISLSVVNIGTNYYYLKIFDSARLYIQQAYNLGLELNFPLVIGGSLYHMGDICFETGQNTLALEYYRLSIPYEKKSENYVRLCYAFLGMAKTFQKTEQRDSSLFYAKQILVVAKERGFTKSLMDACNLLSTLYKSQRNFDSAFFYLEVAKSANDSLFSQQKLKQFQSLSFDEKLRQQEKTATEIKDRKERKKNLQYAAIAIGLISFVILFLLLSRSIIVKTKFIEFFGLLGLLAVFEFINLYIHPYLSRITNDSPVFMLGFLIAVGALLIPLHHRMEQWITKIMVEKNKKIRLASAKKTISKLEPAKAADDKEGQTI